MANPNLMLDYERKQRAVNYFKDNGVPKRLEELLNVLFEDDPDDVYGYMAEHFNKLANDPVICRVRGEEAYDTRGNSTVKVTVYCKINGMEKIAGTGYVSVANSSYSNEKQHHSSPKKGGSKTSAAPAATHIVEMKRDLQRELAFINTFVADSLFGKNPTDQLDIDLALREAKNAATLKDQELIEITKDTSAVTPGQNERKKSGNKVNSNSNTVDRKTSDKVLNGSTMVPINYDDHVLAISVTVNKSAAFSTKQPIYAHVSRKMIKQDMHRKYTLPIPLMTILSRSKSGGKLKFVKDFMILPSVNVPYTDALHNIVKVYQCMGRLSVKGTLAKTVTEMGSYAPAIDKVEQMFDLVRDACAHAHLELAKDIFVAIKCAADEIYDTEKAKYEKQHGIFKSSKEMIENYADLLEKHPALLMIIDPLHKDDMDWAELHSRLNDRCYIIGEKSFNNQQDCAQETAEKCLTVGAVVRLNQPTTVANVAQTANSLITKEQHVILGASYAPENSSFIVDLAVGLGVRFLQLGGPGNSEWTCKYNRLQEIWLELHESHMLTSIPEHPVPKEVKEETTESIEESNGPALVTTDSGVETLTDI